MKVAIAYPSRGDPKPEFLQSIRALIRPAGSQIFTRTGELLENRNALAAAAMEWGADALLFADDDMEFPPDTLSRLLAHDRALVGCNYISRAHGLPTALSLGEDGIRRPIYSTPASPPLEPVSDLGLGVVLIRRAVFEAIKQPWFAFARTTAGKLVGEDYFFCERALAAGFQPHVDHALSLEIGHVAETTLRFKRGDYDIDAVRPSAGP